MDASDLLARCGVGRRHQARNPSGWPLLCDSVAAPIESEFVDLHALPHQPRPFRSRPAGLTRLAVHHCCTELEGGFGFSRNWLTRRAEAFWTLSQEVSDDVCRPGYRRLPTPALGPLFDPAFEETLEEPAPEAAQDQLPLLVLGAGANGANNHIRLLEVLQPLAGKIKVVTLCGRRQAGDGG